MGRHQAPRQTCVCGPLHEHSAVEHRVIRQWRQLRNAGPGPNTMQQRPLDWKSGGRLHRIRIRHLVSIVLVMLSVVRGGGLRLPFP
jgi:hypothetical protein